LGKNIHALKSEHLRTPAVNLIKNQINAPFMG